jgi:hypothetical protein
MNNQESPPSLAQFMAACRADFAYLISDYGFSEAPPELSRYADPFTVRFVRDDLEIVIQGINYGQNVITEIRHGHGATLRPVLLHPDFIPYANNPLPPARGQLNQIAQTAQLLREHGRALLAGDLSVIDNALARYEAGLIAYEAPRAARRRFHTDVEEAVAAYRSANWALVVELLEPREAELSARMARKLAAARGKLIP